MTERFTVGFVRGTHGVAGEFKVESASGEYGHFAQMKEVTLTDGNASRTYKVESTREAANVLYMKLEGIDTPEEAAKLNRHEIVVPRKYAHKLKPNEWYIEDLKGCSVFYRETADDSAAANEDSIVGTVTNVMEGGSGYLVEIKLSEACGLIDDKVKFNKKGIARTVYVPFKDQFIGAVDVENKLMRLMHLWILE